MLALAAAYQNDRVGALLFADEVEHVVPPRKGRRHALRVIRDLVAFPPAGRTHQPRRQPDLRRPAAPAPQHRGGALRLPRRRMGAPAAPPRRAARGRRDHGGRPARARAARCRLDRAGGCRDRATACWWTPGAATYAQRLAAADGAAAGRPGPDAHRAGGRGPGGPRDGPGLRAAAPPCVRRARPAAAPRMMSSCSFSPWRRAAANGRRHDLAPPRIAVPAGPHGAPGRLEAARVPSSSLGPPRVIQPWRLGRDRLSRRGLGDRGRTPSTYRVRCCCGTDGTASIHCLRHRDADRVRSVLPGVPPDSTLQAAAAAREFVARGATTPIPLLILLALALLLLAPAALVVAATRQGGVRSVRRTPASRRRPPLERWADAGESRAVAAAATSPAALLILRRRGARRPPGLDTEAAARRAARRAAGLAPRRAGRSAALARRGSLRSRGVPRRGRPRALGRRARARLLRGAGGMSFARPCCCCCSCCCRSGGGSAAVARSRPPATATSACRPPVAARRWWVGPSARAAGSVALARLDPRRGGPADRRRHGRGEAGGHRDRRSPSTSRAACSPRTSRRPTGSRWRSSRRSSSSAGARRIASGSWRSPARR